MQRSSNQLQIEVFSVLTLMIMHPPPTCDDAWGGGWTHTRDPPLSKRPEGPRAVAQGGVAQVR
eukprot:m.457746 g.457746  ORF g.457746 m.457746 type:complete len:63 (+) comp206910_c0_seq1:67-255(+)